MLSVMILPGWRGHSCGHSEVTPVLPWRYWKIKKYRLNPELNQTEKEGRVKFCLGGEVTPAESPRSITMKFELPTIWSFIWKFHSVRHESKVDKKIIFFLDGQNNPKTWKTWNDSCQSRGHRYENIAEIWKIAFVVNLQIYPEILKCKIINI